jgi:hypothetical protein
MACILIKPEKYKIVRIKPQLNDHKLEHQPRDYLTIAEWLTTIQKLEDKR